jgi:hypothetical protein
MNNNWSTGLGLPATAQPGSAPLLPVSQITAQLCQLYVLIQGHDPLWCLEHPFQSLVNGRSEAQLRDLAESWTQYIGGLQLRTAAPMV